MSKYLKKYKDPKKKRLSRGAKIALFCSVVLIVLGFGAYYWINSAIETNEDYKAACSAMSQKDYDTAISAFLRLGDYKDSDRRLHECCLAAYNEETYQSITSIHAGDVISFGHYEQDADLTNGTEEVEWRVLEVDGTRALLVSVYGLDAKYFQPDNKWTTWETCTLRKWMSETMYQDLFSDEEKKQVLLSTVTPDSNPEYDTDPGNPTEDHLFLLSIGEARKYFSSNNDRQCQATEYAYLQGAFDGTPNGMCWWWLRTPGAHQSKSVVVYHTGSIINYGSENLHPRYVIRPAFWLDLTKA